MLAWTAGAPAGESPPGDQALWLGPERTVVLHFFWSERCPHCLEARPHVQALAERYEWIRLESYEVYHDPANRMRFLEFSALLGIEANSVPTFLWCGRHYTGWAGADRSGTYLLDALAECYRDSYGLPPPDLVGGARVAGPERLSLPLLGELDATALSLPVLTLVLAGLDAFNPCAFFILLFLLSLLVHARNRRLMLIVGAVFVGFSGLIYFLFMAAWLNVFRWVGEIGLITAVAGALAVVMGLINVKDYFWLRRGVSLSLNEGQKGDLFRRARGLLSQERVPALLGGTVVLAVAANTYELLCTAGFPMVYTRVLTLNELSDGGYYAYLALYNLIYVLPLFVIVLLFVRTLGSRKLQEHEGRVLKLVSGLMMTGLGGLLILAPDRLNNLVTAIVLLAGALVIAFVVVRVDRALRSGAD
jgi:thiol-disulfide isomerase/thioredoxin